jgi:hypothetical protein
LIFISIDDIIDLQDAFLTCHEASRGTCIQICSWHIWHGARITISLAMILTEATGTGIFGLPIFMVVVIATWVGAAMCEV